MLRFTLCVFFLVLSARAAEPDGLDLFLLIGQSNMAGRGVVEEQDRTPLANVWMLNKELTWVLAVDPIHYDKPEIAGVGLGRSFAKALLEKRPDAKLGLIPAAFGGTSLAQWIPGGRLYADAMQRAREAMKHGTLRGILWHQGEADSNIEVNARSYRERFSAIVISLRRDLNANDVPLVVGAIGEFLYEKKENPTPYSRLVNEQLASVPETIPHSAFVSSHGLVPKSDIVHFDSPSQREFGRRYAAAYFSLVRDWK